MSSRRLVMSHSFSSRISRIDRVTANSLCSAREKTGYGMFYFLSMCYAKLAKTVSTSSLEEKVMILSSIIL
jgi:hypothetical protein